MTPLRLTDLLEALDYQPGEHLSLNHRRPGGVFTSAIITAAEAGNGLLSNLAGADVWYGVNPVEAGSSGRGTVDGITRLAALWCDLDVKPGGCPDMATAHLIVNDLSEMLTVRPVAVTYSGHGLQPLWAVESFPLTSESSRRAARILLRRWGRLVAHVAGTRNSGVDSVFDLPRVLRAPGTVNHKGAPVAVATFPDTGRPLAADEVLDTLRAYAVPEMAGDDDGPGEIVSNPASWAWAPASCGYSGAAITGWGSDAPTARHPWLMSAAVRLAAMHANGCLTRGDHDAARAALISRFIVLLSAGSEARQPARGEIADALSWGVLKAAAMTPERIASQLGNHPHLTAAPPLRLDDDETSGDDAVEAASEAAQAAALAAAEQLWRLRAHAAAVRVHEVEDVELLVADRVRGSSLAEQAAVAYALLTEPPAPPFDVGTLREVLARPDEPPMRADGLIPWAGSALIVAARKTGKTTLLMNYARCLLTGEDFLGEFPVVPLAPDETVAYLNYEVGAAQLARWAHDVGVDLDRLVMVNLRGRRNPLGREDDRAALAADLFSRRVGAVIVDPFGRAFTGTNQNDNGEVQSFLVGLETFVRVEVGAGDLLLAAHAGWNGERTRGASALEDWGDAVITLTRDVEDESKRFMKALGRDVEVAEDGLVMDPATRILTRAGTGPKAAVTYDRKVTYLAVLVARAVHLHGPAQSKAEVARRIVAMNEKGVGSLSGGRGDDLLAKAILLAESQKQVSVDRGPKGLGYVVFEATTSTTSGLPPGGAPHHHLPPPFRGEVGGVVSEGADLDTGGGGQE